MFATRLPARENDNDNELFGQRKVECQLMYPLLWLNASGLDLAMPSLPLVHYLFCQIHQFDTDLLGHVTGRNCQNINLTQVICTALEAAGLYLNSVL